MASETSEPIKVSQKKMQKKMKYPCPKINSNPEAVRQGAIKRSQAQRKFNY